MTLLLLSCTIWFVDSLLLCFPPIRAPWYGLRDGGWRMSVDTSSPGVLRPLFGTGGSRPTVGRDGSVCDGRPGCCLQRTLLRRTGRKEKTLVARTRPGLFTASMSLPCRQIAWSWSLVGEDACLLAVCACCPSRGCLERPSANGEEVRSGAGQVPLVGPGRSIHLAASASLLACERGGRAAGWGHGSNCKVPLAGAGNRQHGTWTHAHLAHAFDLGVCATKNSIAGCWVHASHSAWSCNSTPLSNLDGFLSSPLPAAGLRRLWHLVCACNLYCPW
ncbi:hypothetical protein B0T16DRAFT_145216 [Cercophora newfieldiana]|uniref:Secreted protein n=1 Tax=Cercophora newfieldiana TaxID=92897 RepID=A0AA39Y5A6_9PEZI|nr:hypothetical protein B0T16DRAFT_145216 [Cercophora newfieldiana]